MVRNDTAARSPQTFTVFGGTGFVGHRIVRALVAAGHRVRVAARTPHTGNVRQDPERIERIRADLFEPSTLRAALKGAAGAVNATSLYVEHKEVTFDAVHVEAAHRLARLAKEAEVSRLIQISGIGADPNAKDRYIRARGRGELAVRDAFPGATIVRPAVMFGAGDAMTSAITGIARMSPAVPLFGSGRTRLQPVAADDVAQAIAMLLTLEEPEPVYEFGGPRVLTYRELVTEILRAANLRRPLMPVPFAVWRLLAGVAQSLPGAPLTRSQVALLEIDNVASDDLPGLDKLVGEQTDLREYLGREFAE